MLSPHAPLGLRYQAEAKDRFPVPGAFVFCTVKCEIGKEIS